MHDIGGIPALYPAIPVIEACLQGCEVNFNSMPVDLFPRYMGTAVLVDTRSIEK